MEVCRQCNSRVNRKTAIYCSVLCQKEYEYTIYISAWLLDKARGDRGTKTKNISAYVRKYLFRKYKSKCSLCGWSETNPVTGRVPVEIDHMNGNAEDNSETNLRLLCPNCHSLTTNYRNLNIGNGRAWRTAKYNKHT